MSWKEDIAALDAKLEEFTRYISVVDPLAVFLHAERAKIERSRFAIIAARAPWRRLPVELLDYIFVLANELSVGHSIPTTLSHVCSEWRARALAMRPLWTRIHINKPGDHRLAELWLSRSEPALVHVDCSIIEYMESLSSFFPAFHLIDRHLKRIAHLRIEVEETETLQEAVKRLTSPAPNLRVFELFGNLSKYSYRKGFVVEGASRIFGGQTPKLETLRIGSPHSPWPSGLLNNLTELIMPVPLDEAPAPLLKFIARAQHLSRLILEECDFMSGFPGDPLRIVTLPSVTYAKLKGSSLGTLGLILQYLDLPKLHTLHLEYGAPTELERVPDFIAPPFPSLHTLIVFMDVGEMMEDEDDDQVQYLPIILRRCASVEVLRLNEIIVLETLIGDLFTPGGSGYPLCPHLLHLEILFIHFTIGGKPLRQFLKGRWNEEKVTSIETLSIDVNDLNASLWDEWRPSQISRYTSLVKTQVKYRDKVFNHIHPETT